MTLQKGTDYPPTVVDVRVKYEQTVSDIRTAVAKKTGVPADMQQLFWHQKELTSAYDSKTLLEMHLHTGFSLKGYDLVSSLYYFLYQAAVTCDGHEVASTLAKSTIYTYLGHIICICTSRCACPCVVAAQQLSNAMHRFTNKTTPIGDVPDVTCC